MIRVEQTETAKQKIDMLHGPIWNKLIQYALPVAATGILEQLFNASDIAIVGNFTGDAKTLAVAAVGAAADCLGHDARGQFAQDRCARAGRCGLSEGSRASRSSAGGGRVLPAGFRGCLVAFV